MNTRELIRICNLQIPNFRETLLLSMQTWTETHYGSRKKWIMLADEGAVGLVAFTSFSFLSRISLCCCSWYNLEYTLYAAGALVPLNVLFLYP